MRVMLADYPQQYRKSYPSKNAATIFKQRLMGRLGMFSESDIMDGYENCIDESPKFMPSIPDLFAHVKILDSKRKQNDAQKIEAEKLSALPAPTRNVNPLKLFNDAKKNGNTGNEEDRAKRIKSLNQNHHAVLSIHGGKITKRYSDKEHECAMGGCFKSGAISSGAGWVCREHYHLA